MDKDKDIPNIKSANKTEATNTGTAQETTATSKTTAASGEASAPAVELPKGGGAIRSIGEKFSANPVTGTASLSIPLPTSKGRNEFKPELSLAYNSGGGNSPFGMGWNVGVASITRKTNKGLPNYTPKDVFLLAGAEDLVPVLDGNGDIYERDETDNLVYRYRPRVEGLYHRIERWENKNSGISHWRLTDKENVTSIFGEQQQARVFDPNNEKNVFEWMIEKRFDALGNIIQYEYKRENEENVNGGHSWESLRLRNGESFNRLYPKKLFYGNTQMYPSSSFESANDWHFQVVFDYGEHDLTKPTPFPENSWKVRQDPFSTYNARFELRTYRLCHRILLFHQFSNENEGNPLLVKALELNYEESPTATQLTSVKQRAYRNGISETIPALKFSYTRAKVNPIVKKLDSESIQNLPAGLGNNYRWADLYGEGISGVLTQSANAWFYKPNQGDKNYYKDHPQDEQPQPVPELGTMSRLKSHPTPGTTADLQDIDGDGQPEVVVRQPGLHGFFKWEADSPKAFFQAFDGAPNLDWESPDLRFVDLTGDGLADILITEQDQIEWVQYHNHPPGYDKPKKIANALEEEKGPRVVFSNGKQNIFLADMSGDGLSDLLRIENGSVSYWPNLGYGHFGAKVAMGNISHFDRRDFFDASRIRLGDTDGSGTTDIIYLGVQKTTYHLNQSGNSLAEPVELELFPRMDNLENVSLTDIFGNGTACLVWSSPEEKAKPFQIRYIDLMGQKPYLLEETDNSMGALRKFSYAPSTKFYLRDQRNGTPWATKLPFPVQTLERVEIYEQITARRFVSRYAYHHGYFDPHEREFRGFGMVEQWDSENYNSFQRPALYSVGSNALEEESHTPPIYTKSWFHNGYYSKTIALEKAYQKEYWKGDDEAWHLPSVVFSPQQYADWMPDELREAHRALKGSLLRQEIYGLDATDKEDMPYQVTENSFFTHLLQKKKHNHHAIFRTLQRESLTFAYERESTDPRINHQLTLETDNYGNVLQAAQVAYPRRGSGHQPEQQNTYISVSQASFINKTDSLSFYRIGAPEEQSLWELRSSTNPISENNRPPWRPNELKNAIDNATLIPPETNFSGTGNEKQLQSQIYNTYYSQNLANELPVGEIAAHGLPYRNYQLAFTEGLINNIYNSGTTRIDLNTSPNPITESGYIETSFSTSGNWWVPSGRMIFDANSFYLLNEQHDPFGGITKFTYDDYNLLITQVEDPIGNKTWVDNEYVGLQPWQITDANGNRQAVELDALGRVTAQAVMGKAPSDPDYPGYEQGDSLAAPGTTFTYDLHAFEQHGTPASVKVVKRETHIHSPNANNETLTEVAFTDGLGKELQRRVQFGPESSGENETMPVTVTGRQIKNNKDLVVVQYEPYLSTGLAYSENTPPEAAKIRMTYDALNRLVRTDFEDGTFTKVGFNAWQQREYDQNDTVMDSQWYIDRGSPDPSGNEPSDPEERAAWLAAKAFNTPRVMEVDPLGRMFLRRNDNGDFNGSSTIHDYYSIRFYLDIQGRHKKVTNELGQETVFEHNLLPPDKQKTGTVYTDSPDNGWRLVLVNVVKNPVRQWDERGHRFRNEYDIAQRPIKNWVDEGAGEKLADYQVFEENINMGSPRAKNLKGQILRSFDESGMMKNKEFDFKGNLLKGGKQLAVSYKGIVDWSFLTSETSLSGLDNTAQVELQTEEFENSTEYDALNRSTLAIQPDGTQYKPTYNKAALPEKMASKLVHESVFSEIVTDINYNSKKQRTAVYYGNGSKTKYTYDPATFRLKRLLTTRNNGQDIMQDLNYTFDGVGNITEMTDNAQQTEYFKNSVISPRNKYTYNSIYRLTKATGREKSNLPTSGSSGYTPEWIPTNGKSSESLSSYCRQYSYDAMGNILELIHRDTCNGNENWRKIFGYNSGMNNNYLLSSYTGNTPPTSPQFSYDAHGNMLQMPHLQAMNWDYADQLRFTEKNDETIYYVYSGGERIRKVVVDTSGPNEKIKYERIYLGDYELYRKYDASDNLESERKTHHIQGEGQATALLEVKTTDNGSLVTNPNTIRRYQYGNHLGSACLELDGNAEVLSYQEYHPFGTTSFEMHTNDSEVSLKRYQYVFKERDDETGLYYYGARYYAGWLCRFVSVDPLKDDYPQLSPYNYASNNPVTDKDVDGLQNEREETIQDMQQTNVRKFEQDNTAVANPRHREDAIQEASSPQNSEKLTTKERAQNAINFAEMAGEMGSEVQINQMKFEDVRYVGITINQGDFKLKQQFLWSENPQSSLDQSILDTPLFDIDSPGLGAYLEGLEEFGKKGGKLTKSTTPLKSTGDIKFYDNGWKGNQYIKTKNVFNKGLTKRLAKYVPYAGDLVDAYEIGKGFYEDNYTVGKNTKTQLAGFLGGIAGAAAGAKAGAFIGSLIAPGIGTVIGGAAGAILGGWLLEEAAETTAEQALSKEKSNWWQFQF